MAVTGALATGCEQTECGSGTIERNGVCVASAFQSDGGFSAIQCDPNVSKFEGGRCVPLLPPVICETARLEVDDAGIGHCKEPESTSCEQELPCGAPSGIGGDEICLAGRVVDGADHTKPVAGADLDKIEVRVYEPLNFLADTTTPPFRVLTRANGLDECGRYTTRFSVSQDTPNGLVAIAIFGKVGSASANDFILGASASRPQANVNITAKLAFQVSKAQDMTWTTAAGLAASTFAGVGSLAVRFHTAPGANLSIPGGGIEGVLPRWNNVSTPAGDYFFSDVEAAASTKLTTIDAAKTRTRPNGVAFMTIGKGIGNVTAEGGTSGSCQKAGGGGAGTLTVTGPTLAGSADNVIFFFNLEATCL